MNKEKPVELTTKELNKFIRVLGPYRVKMLFVEDKIKLTNDQLNYLMSIKNGDSVCNQDKKA